MDLFRAHTNGILLTFSSSFSLTLYNQYTAQYEIMRNCQKLKKMHIGCPFEYTLEHIT